MTDIDDLATVGHFTSKFSCLNISTHHIKHSLSGIILFCFLIKSNSQWVALLFCIWAVNSSLIIPFSPKKQEVIDCLPVYIYTMRCNCVIAFCFFILSPLKLHGISSMAIHAPASLMDTVITRLAILDVQQLLQQACQCEVLLNHTEAEIILALPDIPTGRPCLPNRFQQQANVAYYPYPAHDYTWRLVQEGSQLILQLETECWQGVSFGLYGLLQEQLGFRFYHPRETYIPSLKSFPLQPPFKMEGRALFDKKGFHLHTQHPIELTEQLHDGTIADAFTDVKQYIDWLVHNGQTYFEFCLLESIDRKKWIEHAKAIVDYGHQRGLLMGVDLSLHMIQQKTFQLYKNVPQSFRSKKKQIRKNLAWLTQAGWDVFNMEFTAAEFIGGNYKKKERLRLYIIEWLQKNSHAKLMGRKHVVSDDHEIMAKKHLTMDSAQAALDRQRGLLIHTVMFYSMTDTLAPVYENKNLRHMYELLKQEMPMRETWYYPESAYWVTFDNTIPMFLLPYLNARLADIDTCVALGVPGHVTFSSGWEWGYWLFDWSIARWSWEYKINDTLLPRHPLDGVRSLFGNHDISSLFQEHLNLQQKYLKDQNLIQWLTAMTVIDEMPFGFNKVFQPRPHYSYKKIANSIDSTTVEEIQIKVIPQLYTFGNKTIALCNKMEKTFPAEHPHIAREWIDALRVTGYRSLHRFFTLQYLLNRRRASLYKQPLNNPSLIDSAASVRLQALKMVQQRESNYRYPAELLARRRKSFTAYQFGYLYPVSTLHFWQREEQQALRNKWRFTFMNIWDVMKIIGLKN